MTALSTHLQCVAAPDDTGQRRIAFFDLDRTLIAGYSVLAMAVETARHAAARGQLAQSARLLQDVARQKRHGSGAHYHKLVKRLASALSGVAEQTLAELGEKAWSNHVARSLYSEAVALVEAHRAAGDLLVIISAASRYQVEPVARALGIDEVCCTQLAVENGRFTGEVIAPLCYGEGKTMAARRVARRHQCSLKNSWFYSDSSADLPLLNRVGRPVAVNPSEKLAIHVRNKGWPQLTFQSRGMPQLENITRTVLVAQTLVATTALGSLSRRLGVNPSRNANRLTRLLGDIGGGFAGLEFEVEGAENLRGSRPAIYVFNHQSLLDSMVLAHLLREDVVALCKKEMASNPLIGPLLRQVDTIFVDRDDRDQGDVLKQALQVLASGRSLCVAPEGTRSTLGNIQPFKHGAFLLAKRAGVPIVPIVLHNVKDALPKGAMLLRPATIRVTVLDPIVPEQIRGIRQSSQALEETYSAVLGASPSAALPYRLRA
jgi:putative phosphoserine phosphatase/1-acylglycerol-3-phosphate O-acyltransferase